MNRTPPAHAKPFTAGFTLTEIAAALAIVAVLTMLLLPSLSRVRSMAMAARCQSNLRQLGVLLQLYANDNGGLVIGDVLGDNGAQGTWADGLLAYVSRTKFTVGERPTGIFSCPAGTVRVTNSNKSDYTKNYYVNPPDTSTRRKFKLMEVSTQPVIALADGIGRNFNEATPSIAGRHDGKANTFYFDGHMESTDPAQLPLLSGKLPLYPQ